MTLSLIFILLLTNFSGCSKKIEGEYDLLIVGGGVSGLMSAYELREFPLKIAILEKNERPGGRIYTRFFQGEPYEMGALTIPPLSAFMDEEKNISAYDNEVGFSKNGNILWGKTPEEILTTLGFKVKEENWISNFELLPEEVKITLNSFFGSIYPGKMTEYVEERFRDALIKIRLYQRKEGNYEVIKNFLKEIKAQILLNSEVKKIEELDKGYLKITYLRENKKHVIRSKYAILTPPAPVSVRLLEKVKLKEEILNFLKKVKYFSCLSAVLILKKNIIPTFSYVVFENESPKVVYELPCLSEECVKLYLYYDGKRAQELANMEREAILQELIDDLRKGGIEDVKMDNILFFDYIYWDYLSPLINDTFYNIEADGAVWATERIIIAGEYMWAGKERQKFILPYGVLPAMKSGSQAANLIKKRLEEEK